MGVGVRRIAADETLQWYARFTGSLNHETLAISHDEQNLYFATSLSTLTVIQVDANTGSCTNRLQFSSVRGMSVYTQVHPMTDNLGFYVVGSITSSPYTTRF
mmetsp:Transcript_36/g.38  ORF Transcript_36/g.38 Transcript_36/m.38 type:complete len:102 (+) Transcript_36:247-552(+)